jgi:hypothetical protein
LDRSLEATANSLQAARALGDITNLIDETLLAFDKGNRRKVKSCMELVNKALPIVQTVISENISKACPKVGAGANYSVSRINSEEKKRKAIEQPLKMGQSVKQRLHSDSYTSVKNIVRDHKAKVLSSDLPSPCSRYALLKSEPPVTPLSTRPETRYSLAAFPADGATPEFPKPVDGNAQFFPAEVVSILDSFGEGKVADKKRQAVKNAMLNKRLIGPTTKAGFNKFLAKVKQSGGTVVPIKWSQLGRPELLSVSELRVIAADLRVKHGHTVKLPLFTEMVTDHLRAKYQAEGKATFGVDITPSARTVKHMMTLLATLREQEILDFTPQRKTDTRCTAENSLMSAISFGTTVAGTHFLPGPDPTGRVMPTNITKGAAEMIRLVQEANGGTAVHLVQLGSLLFQGSLSSEPSASLATHSVDSGKISRTKF